MQSLYRGEIVYNRQSFVKDPATGKRQARPNPPHLWQRQDVPKLRIVPQELWDRAEARRREIGHKPFSRRARPKHLLSGLMKCAICGASFIVASGQYLGCSAYRNKRTCENHRTITMDEIVDRVLDALQRHLLSPEAVAAVVEAYRLERQRPARDRAKNEGALTRELGELQRKIKRWVHLLGDGALEPGDIKDEFNAASRRRDEVEAQLRAVPRDDAAVLHPHAATRYRHKVAELHAAIKAGGEKADQEVVELVRGMIDAIEILPGPERMELTVVGTLASFLHRQQDGASIATPMVAGIGIEPMDLQVMRLKNALAGRCNWWCEATGVAAVRAHSMRSTVRLDSSAPPTASK